MFKILKYPNTQLRKIAKPVQKINNYIKNIIHKMFKTMYKHHGIGLAATQVNIHLQIIVIDLINKKYNPIVLINPKKIHTKNLLSIEEKCLSIPGITKKITRSKEIEIQAMNYYGKTVNIKAKNLLSICIQHEMDHLIGKLIIDY